MLMKFGLKSLKNLKLHKNRASKKTITLVNNIMFLFFFKSRLTEIQSNCNITYGYEPDF